MLTSQQLTIKQFRKALAHIGIYLKIKKSPNMAILLDHPFKLSELMLVVLHYT
jgi:hypothetical protein